MTEITMPDARPASGNRSNRRRVGFPRPYVCETLESFRVWFGHRKWFAGGPSIAFGAACPLASTCSCISRGSTRRPRLARPCFRCLACSASLSSKWLRGRHGRVECRRIVCFSGRLAAHCPLSGVVAVRRLRRVHWSKEVGSVSKPEELVANHSGTRLLSEGPGPARNFGMRYATSDIIAFIDADCRAHRDWLRNRCLNSTLMRPAICSSVTRRRYAAKTGATSWRQITFENSYRPELEPTTRPKTSIVRGALYPSSRNSDTR